MKLRCLLLLVLGFSLAQGTVACEVQAAQGEPFPGTTALAWDPKLDIASELVSGADRFLLRAIERSIADRPRHWHRDQSGPVAYARSLEPQRQRLAHILGVRDPRVPFDGLEIMATTTRSGLVGTAPRYHVQAVRWPAFGDVHGEGLLVTPTNTKPRARVVAIPDCAQSPEQWVGLNAGVPPLSQVARRLAENGCEVLVVTLIDRQTVKHFSKRPVELTNREFVYRPAFELGRHIIGYEVQKVLAAVDYFATQHNSTGKPTIGVMGYGEGGLLALYAGALDERIAAVCVSGYFDSRQDLWQEPIDRNVFGLLEQFGDAELASMVLPRTLVIEAARGPEATFRSDDGAPARLVSPDVARTQAEVERSRHLVNGLDTAEALRLIISGNDEDDPGPFGSAESLAALFTALCPDAEWAAASNDPPERLQTIDERARMERQVHELDRHTQQLLHDSADVRAAFMSQLDTSSPQSYQQTSEQYRRRFAEEIIGQFPDTLLPANPRTRQVAQSDRWTRYEVVLDVFPDVIARGLLTIPTGIGPNERRPVVVCQHGLEGRPEDTIEDQRHDTYRAFSTELANRGFITFAPQNLYVFEDRFRSLQRKANPLKKTLFSLMVPQHQQITDWLKSLPQVNPSRIAFYGLSYGGKSAMRIPPLVSNYCLSICSADFNEWIWKNASTRSRYSYVFNQEYEIFEFDLGNTFGYAEMAALIAPRPFMVERGHFDGVAPDETVAYEYAKVRHLYAARLGLAERTEIEWFVGPHSIHGVGSYDFLHRHLNWPIPK